MGVRMGRTSKLSRRSHGSQQRVTRLSLYTDEKGLQRCWVVLYADTCLVAGLGRFFVALLWTGGVIGQAGEDSRVTELNS